MPPQVEYDHPEKGDALYAFELSLSLEKLNNDRLLSLHAVAADCDDANMQDFIEGELLADQVKSIQEISEMVAQLRRMGNKGDAVWHFDQQIAGTSLYLSARLHTVLGPDVNVKCRPRSVRGCSRARSG